MNHKSFSCPLLLGEERLLRFGIFKRALRFVERQNHQTQEWQVEMNKFSLMVSHKNASVTHLYS